jgi:hypothetical protein
MTAMNRIAEILKEKGINELTPNDELLADMEIKLHTWNKIVGNKKDPEFFQIPIIAKILQVEIEELFPRKEIESLKSKQRFVSA